MAGVNGVQSGPIPGQSVRYSHPLLRGLLLTVPMTEGGGGLCNDPVYGKRYTFTGPGWGASKNGTAGKFDGTTSYVTLASQLSDLFTTGGIFTVCFWFQRISGTSWSFFGSQDGGASGILLDYNVAFAGKLGFSKLGVAGGDSSVLWTADNAPHHLAFTANGTNSQIIMDGAVLNNATVTAGFTPGGIAHTVVFGARNVSNSIDFFFNGTINDFRIYMGRALTLTDVRDIYTNTWNYFASEPVRRRSFSDGTTPVTTTTVSYAGLDWPWD